MSDQGPKNPSGTFRHFFSGRRLFATIPILVAVVSGIGVPFWWEFVIETPLLSLEISAISRKIPDKARVDLETVPEFRLLKPLTSKLRRGQFEEEGQYLVSPQELQSLLKFAKKDLVELPKSVEVMQRELDLLSQLKAEDLTLARFKRFVGPILEKGNLDLIGFDDDDFTKTFVQNREDLKSNKQYFENALDVLKQGHKQIVTETAAKLTELQSNMGSIERGVENIIKGLDRTRSRFTVSVALRNSGKESISIKRPALLRVYIGTENYVDLKLTLQNYSEDAEISAQGTNITSFRSQELTTLPKEDQKLINTYWGQSVHAILFIEDINRKIYPSNRISFAGGLYQKLIYDRLAAEASTKQYFLPIE